MYVTKNSFSAPMKLGGEMEFFLFLCSHPVPILFSYVLNYVP
jgi:hypothetical protein